MERGLRPRKERKLIGILISILGIVLGFIIIIIGLNIDLSELDRIIIASLLLPFSISSTLLGIIILLQTFEEERKE